MKPAAPCGGRRPLLSLRPALTSNRGTDTADFIRQQGQFEETLSNIYVVFYELKLTTWRILFFSGVLSLWDKMGILETEEDVFFSLFPAFWLIRRPRVTAYIAVLPPLHPAPVPTCRFFISAAVYPVSSICAGVGQKLKKTQRQAKKNAYNLLLP